MDVSSFRIRYELPARARVSVIIPTRDRVDLLRTCISSIQRTVDLDRVELVIVNNASVEPETYAYLRDISSRPYVQVLDYHAPFNYSKINNFGVRRATGDYLLFLNNDTEAETTGWLEALLEHAQRPDVGAVGCRLLYPGRQRRVQHGGVILGMGGVAGHAHKRRRSAESTFYGPNRITNYSAVTAACLMMRRSVFELVGGFDEELAVAFNDIDLCLRVGQRGFRVVYTPFATLIHHESISVGRPEDGRSMDEFEIQRMHARWGPLLRADPYYNPNLPLDQEDFVSAVANQYSPGSSASGIRRIGARTSNPLWALPGIAMHVLWYEGPTGLARETVRYVKERV